MSTRKLTFGQRLASMTEEELHAALRRTAECDRTIDAEWLASINDDRAEARRALESMYEPLYEDNE